MPEITQIIRRDSTVNFLIADPLLLIIMGYLRIASQSANVYFMIMNFKLSIGDSLKELGKQSWNRLASGNRTPLYLWEWLTLLEDSGSISTDNGWVPLHLSVKRGEQLAAVLPLYGKTHSSGEFVYDFAWADLAAQFNLPYYPKLVGTVPATPSGFYSVFADGVEAETAVYRFLSMDFQSYAEGAGINSSSFLFSDPRLGESLTGYSPWVNQSFLWVNRGYRDFNDYLADLGKNQRRNVRREWASLDKQNLEIHALTGSDLTQAVMEGMYRFYLRTNSRFGPWAARFLNREFFLMLPDYFAEHTVIFAAVPAGKPAEEASAMSMCLYGGDWLFGRYWGAGEDIPNLHFNLCYYAPIQWMIQRGMKYFDPGAGSPHKLKRGFMPHGVVSYHRYFQPEMQELFSRNINYLNQETGQVIAEMEDSVPFSEEVKTELRETINLLFPLSLES